jgi:hypothetical protein
MTLINKTNHCIRTFLLICVRSEIVYKQVYKMLFIKNAIILLKSYICLHAVMPGPSCFEKLFG